MNAQLRAIIGMGICRGNGLSGQGETMTMRQSETMTMRQGGAMTRQARAFGTPLWRVSYCKIVRRGVKNG